VAAVVTAEAVAVPMAAAEAVSMAAELEAPTAVVGTVTAVADLAAVGNLVVAALEAASGLLAEVVTPMAAGRELAAIPARREIVHRIFLPPSTMGSGIRSATPAVPRVPVLAVPCIPAKDAIPESGRARASPLVTPEFPMALGTPLAGQAALRQEARPV